MANTAFLYVLGTLILLACIVIIVLLAKKQRDTNSHADTESIERYIHESIHAALRQQNEELAKQYGEIFREAERIDNMLSDDEIDLAFIAEAASIRVLAMQVGRLEDECTSLTSDIRKVSQKLSLANGHLANHIAVNNSAALALNDQKNIRELEAQKEHLEKRLELIQRKLDEFQKVTPSA